MAQMEGASAAGSGSTRKPGASGDAAAAAQKSSRRRTKTGCLTCRKRRIKCGEEQPVCNNCIKSKRECEGYKQPVVFRQPTSDYSHPYAVATAFAGPFAGVQVPGYHLDLAGATGNEHVAYKRTSRQQFQQFDGQAWPHEQHQNLPGMPVGLISSTAAYDASREPPRPPQTFVFPQAQGQSQYQWSQHIGAQAVFQQQQQQPPPPQQHHHQHPQPNTQIFSYEHHVVEAPRHSFSQDHFPPTTISHAPDDHSWSSQPHLPPQFSALYAVPEALRSSSSSFSNDFYDSDLTHSATTAEHTMQHHVTAPLVGVKQELISPGQPLSLGQNYSAESLTFRIVGDERRYSSLGFVQHPTFTKSILTTTDRSLPKITPPLPPDDDEDDQDPWDVELDFADSDSVPLSQSQHDLNTMLVKFATHNDRRPRTFTTFLDGPSILATYRPSLSGSPLNDEKVARIFCHFISVTGPCLSIFERQASLPPMTFSNTEIPASQKTLWTYTLPSIALHHPALLHAMLALSALHIAKLQETSEDPAIKHYTYAVRRISKLLSLPKRRHEIATLAANLLVGFYEVMFADHSRWNVHLAGAKVLVMEFDFASMTRIIRNMRSRARFNVAGRPAMSYEEWLHIVGIPESLLDDRDWELSEILVSKLTGYHIEYDRQWQPNFPSSEPSQDFSAKDIDEYKAKSDLYWWYCKQDIFQSMVSGDPLLMPYRRWIYCPPRGQIGKADAPYATMDYLCLIMARLTDFGGKDRARKQKVIKSQGGQWRPPPGLFPQAKPVPGPMAGSAPQSSPNPHLYSSQRQPGNALLSPQQVSLPRTSSLLQQPSMGPSQAVPNMGPPPSTTAGPLGGPGFYGMMPLATDSVEMHSAFYKMNASIHDNAFHQPSPDEDYAHSQSLEDETAAAIREHSEIVKAFDLFIDSLGPEYQCLPADSCPPISTPFGPALQYRTYPIACVLGFYYVGRILIHRFHPHMPPAAMVAAGVTAHLTMEYAQKVGRICAGLYYPQQYSLQTGNLNPALGAALMECTFFLLFAGIQFRDAGQRGWTISKLGDIAQKTGWPTSAAIAAACETAWQKMGMAGKGPPYTPTMDNKHGDIRLARMNKRGYYEEDYDDDVKADEDQNEGHDGPALPGYDRDGIRKNKSTRTHWALGLLSVEKDIERLNLDNK